MSTSINTVTGTVLEQYSSVTSQKYEIQANTVSILLDGESDMYELTTAICGAQSDYVSISAISTALSSAIDAMEETGVSEDALGNLTSFVSQLQDEDYDSASIISVIGDAQELATSDSDSFEEIFSSSDLNSTTTISAISDALDALG